MPKRYILLILCLLLLCTGAASAAPLLPQGAMLYGDTGLVILDASVQEDGGIVLACLQNNAADRPISSQYEHVRQTGQWLGEPFSPTVLSVSEAGDVRWRCELPPTGALQTAKMLGVLPGGRTLLRVMDASGKAESMQTLLLDAGGAIEAIPESWHAFIHAPSLWVVEGRLIAQLQPIDDDAYAQLAPQFAAYDLTGETPQMLWQVASGELRGFFPNTALQIPGGYLLAGASLAEENAPRSAVAAISDTGEMLWQYTHQAQPEAHSILYAALPAAGGGYILSGLHDGPARQGGQIVRLDGAGQVLSEKDYGDDGLRTIADVQPLGDGFAALAMVQEARGTAYALLLLDAQGDVLRQIPCPMALYRDGYPRLYRLDDGRLLVLGNTVKTNGDWGGEMFAWLVDGQ